MSTYQQQERRAHTGHAATPPKAETRPCALELTGVGVRFGALQAVDDVNLTITAGERHAILGPNGAGKTTLFNLITGDISTSNGQIVLEGRDVTHLPPATRIRAGLRRTYQKSLLFGTLTVRDNLFLALRGINGGHFSLWHNARDEALMAQAEDLAARVHLEDALKRTVSELSYGQQRQLEIGMALVGTPHLILFDEPAAGLSPSERKDLLALIRALPRSLTIAMIEHDLDIAMTLSDRVTIMQDGRIVTTGTPDEIAANPDVQRIYLGDHHV